MNTTPDQPGRSPLTGPLWLIAVALSVIAVCLVWQRVGELLRPEEATVAAATLSMPRSRPQPHPEQGPMPLRPTPARAVAISRPSAVRAAEPVAVNPVELTEIGAPVTPEPSPATPVLYGVAPATRVTILRTNSGGVIAGSISLRGTPPPEKPLPLDPVCGRLYPPQTVPTTRFYVVGNNGGLADVFVYIREGLKGKRFPTPDEAVLLDQAGCVFEPYVLGLQTRQKLLVRNSDPILHNVHSTPLAHGNRESNRAQPAGSRDLDYTFPEPEIFVRFKCDVHPWMFAYVGVVEHPYFAVSGPDGTFVLDDVPPGRYVLEAVHRKAGKQEREIVVTKGRPATVDFAFDVPTNL